MSRKSRDKGARIEREIVNAHRGIGVPAERIPLSGAAGGSFSGDVSIGAPPLQLRGEVKARANGEGFATLERWLGTNEVLFLRRDRAQPVAVVPWSTWVRLLAAAGMTGPVVPPDGADGG